MKASYENPLIPHARMRALYRAMVELRVLGERLPRSERVPKGLEACWAGTALELRDGDLTSDLAGASLPGYLREIAMRGGTGLAKKATLSALLAAPAKPFAGSAPERLFCAVGAAMALKAANSGGIALAYLRADELTAAEWKRLLRVACPGELPLILVATGSTGVSSQGLKLPIIPVDGADVVAIHRVAQESILRARAEGGVTVIDCISSRLDPLRVMSGQLTAKGIASLAWMAGVEAGMRRVLASV